jgi:hypothetical protein
MSQHDKVTEAITAMVDAVNRGEFGRAAAAFTAEPIIVEDIAPFRWHGPNAPSAWLAAMGDNASRLGVQSIVMDLGSAVNIVTSDNAAYAAFPGHLILVRKDGELRSSGILTFVLAQRDNSWLIDTLVWSGPEPSRERA